jgi:hypothetical protein
LLFFLSTVFILPLSDVEILIKNKCVSGMCPPSSISSNSLGEWHMVQKFDFICITLTESILSKLSAISRSDLALRYINFYFAYWYL